MLGTTADLAGEGRPKPWVLRRTEVEPQSELEALHAELGLDGLGHDLDAVAVDDTADGPPPVSMRPVLEVWWAPREFPDVAVKNRPWKIERLEPAAITHEKKGK